MPLSNAFSSLKDSQFVDLFTEAECSIKNVELLYGELSFPAINQLRYAGCHIVRYIADPSLKDEIRQAETHCKRAIYDACEVNLLYTLKEIRQFKTDYRKVRVSKVLSEYPKYLEEISRIEKFISPREKESREEYYQEAQKSQDRLIEGAQFLDGAREELNKLYREQRNATFFKVAGLAVSVIIALFVVLRYYFPPGS